MGPPPDAVRGRGAMAWAASKPRIVKEAWRKAAAV